SQERFVPERLSSWPENGIVRFDNQRHRLETTPAYSVMPSDKAHLSSDTSEQRWTRNFPIPSPNALSTFTFLDISLGEQA
ncbi:10829_t:CDS:2, partial [Acaulospora colombiana]